MNEDCLFKDFCNTQCSSGCLRYLETKFLLDNSNIPKSRQVPDSLVPSKCDLEAFEELSEVRSEISDFVETGKNLYIYSKNFGNGKTSWAIKLMINYFSKIWAGNCFKVRGLFISVPEFLSNCKTIIETPNKEFSEMRNIIDNVDLVIWDDIASQNLSNFDYANLLTHIDKRVLNRKANIYTGNLYFKGLSKAVGNRLASRILNSNTKVVKFEGSDRR